MKPINSRRREIFGILLFSFAVFSLISLYVEPTSWVGWFGEGLRSLLQKLFGEVSFLFSFIVLVIAVKLFRGTLLPIKIRKVIGWLLLLSCLTALLHLTAVYQGRGYQLPPSMAEELKYADGVGAGQAGAVFMVLFLSAFGIPGTYIMLGGLSLIGIILVFNISFISLFSAVFAFISKLVNDGFSAVVDLFNTLKHKLQVAKEKRALARLEALANAPAEPQSEASQPAPSSKPHSANAKKPRQAKKKRTKTAESASETEEDVTAVLEPELPTASESGAEQSEDEPEFMPAAAPQRAYRLPPVYLLKKAARSTKRGVSENKQQLLEETFTSFGIDARVVNICQGPVVTRYELQIGPGIKVSRITSLADDIALALAATDVRIEAPVPGKSVVGIEVPNDETQPVLLREVVEHPDFSNHQSKVALALGKDIAGNPVVGDLRKWLHLLIAGATGSGKSVCLNTIIISLLYRATPDEVKLMLVDPKRVELSNYDGVPHLISPVITDPKKAAAALRWAVAEMERRYKLFADHQVRNIEAYYQLLASKADDSDPESQLEFLPYIVVIIDELADLMMVAAADVEEAICRLAQMARAAGMYLIIATQRPSVDVITGLIKANVPSRIAFAVSSQVDSRTILDMGGAERLIGKGDMLYYPLGANKPTRAQGAFISDKEVEAVVEFWKKQGEPEYREDVVDEKPTLFSPEEDHDELLEDAIRLVVETGQASISMLQRRFRIGYSRAARLIDMMEVRSIVGPHQGSKPREVLVDRDSLDL